MSKISRASDSMWHQAATTDHPIPGGFNNWDEYDAWLDGVLASGQHPDEPPRPPRETQRRTLEDVQRDDDLRSLTHQAHKGGPWTQTGPDELRKTDWAGISHKMVVGVPGDPVVLHSTYPQGMSSPRPKTLGSMRAADDEASRRATSDVLVPQLSARGLDFHVDPNDSSSAIKRDEDGWLHRISPFKDYRGQNWYSYYGRGTGRDHPTLDAAVQHAKTRQDPTAGWGY